MSNPPETASALADDKIIVRLAEFVEIKVLNGFSQCCQEEIKRWWKNTDVDFSDKYCEKCGKKCSWITINSGFDPLNDWNAWRQVEERVMEDEDDLFMRFVFTAIYDTGMVQEGSYRASLTAYLMLDLPTRCKALIAALDSLKKHG